MTKPLIVNCPTCAEPVAWLDSNTHRPFCSERCQQIDLGAWATEEYSIAAQQQDEWELAEATSEHRSNNIQ